MTDDFVNRAMASGNGVIIDAIMKCQQVFDEHEHALVSISGGATLIACSTSASR